MALVRTVKPECFSCDLNNLVDSSADINPRGNPANFTPSRVLLDGEYQPDRVVAAQTGLDGWVFIDGFGECPKCNTYSLGIFVSGRVTAVRVSCSL